MADLTLNLRLEKDDYNFNLGSYHRKVTTSSPDAQKWFDRGLIWSFAFNHDEAAECFKHAISNDPECALAYWGYAYVIGPNYNKPWDVFGDEERKEAAIQAHQAAIMAKTKAKNASLVEQALIEALQFRYPENHWSDTSEWNKSYAKAMEYVYEQFGDDLDVAALYAEALMNLTPWGLWDIQSGEPAPEARTLEAKQVLDRALSQSTTHPGKWLSSLQQHCLSMILLELCRYRWLPSYPCISPRAELLLLHPHNTNSKTHDRLTASLHPSHGNVKHSRSSTPSCQLPPRTSSRCRSSRTYANTHRRSLR
jgi:tetratricopeptide (TPR) repeat protein